MKKLFFSSLLVLLTMVGIVPRLAAQTTPQYGVELLTNIPPAATDFTGWTVTSEYANCIPECSEGWFKTSYEEGTISQTIDLAAKGYTPVASNTLFLYAATEYKVGWAIDWQDGIAQMYIECLDADNNVLASDSVLNRTGKFGKVDSTLVYDMFSIPANTTQVRYVLSGRDQCRWGGYYGTWFRNMSCKVYDNTKFNESIQVSVAPELRDSITLSKTTDFHYGDTITISPTYSEHPILWWTINEGKVINTNQVVCLGENIVINAHLKYPHAITLNGTHATLAADKITASIGDTVTLSYTLDENSYWGNYTTNIDVTWVDANSFIMPDAPVAVGNTAITVKSLPYFEGFENGNTQDAVVADWLQQSEYGDYSWVANSTNRDYNRTPYAGSWNATLLYDNTDWLFQALALEAGENYVLSLYARQDYTSTSYANITAALGTACSKDAMTTTLIPETGLTNGDYQLLTDTFQVAETKPYVLGIRGYIDDNPWYISMDNIMVEQEVYPASIATPVGVDGFTEDVVRKALAALSLPAQDTKGNTKCAISNLPENWVLDLENKKATYTAADSLLPMGYFFSNTTATITVALQLNTYSLSFATNDAAMGSVSSTHEADTYNYGTEVTLSATADEHYHFVQWSDGTTEATYTFTLTQDTILTAIFEGNPHSVKITAGENGTVKMEVNDVETTETVFAYGTEIVLTATANTGYSFDKWSDDNTDNPRTITVTENVTLSATFKQDAPTQLSETNAETKVEKVLRNGQVFIIRNGNTYDLTGRKAE